MRNLFLCILFLLSISTLAQNSGTITIKWNQKTEMQFGDSTLNIPQFEGTSYLYDTPSRTILYSSTININTSTQNNKIVLSDIVYENISNTQLGDLPIENIPSTPEPKLSTYTARNSTQTFFTVSPIINDETGVKRITSFSYQLIGSNTSKTTATNRTSSGITNSVLASGDWYRFYIEKSGVYKISKKFLDDLGLNTNSLDPKKISLYGNGGRMLPLSNSIDYPIDLLENAIKIIGEEDGKFDNEDYILFYAEGIENWNSESNTNLNLYDTKSYYYITISGSKGKRIQEYNQPQGNSTLQISTFDDYQFHEQDLINISRLGRQWFGESFDFNSDQEFTFNFPNIDSSVPLKIRATFAAAAFTPTSFTVNTNGQNTASINIGAITANSGINFNTASLPSNTTATGSEATKIKISYNNNGVPGSKGYLDYISVIAKRKLQGYGKQFRFQYDLAVSSSGIAQYTINNAAGIAEVWDITNLADLTKIENNKQDSFSFKSELGVIKKYIAIDPLDYYSPLKENRSKVTNQNIKGTIFKNNQGLFTDVDYVIITPNSLVTQAEKLANFHRSYSMLNVKVISTETIYQEFSAGKQDIAAIRNCIKYIYDNASTPDKKLKYINLFGDASYDYKNRTPNNSNIVPIYHALNSNSIGESCFASDDFYGLMDSNEGNIISFFGGIDITVGRMLVNDALQADEMVNKVLQYHDAKSLGNWRNNVVIIADDSDITSDVSIQNKQNNLADLITVKKPFFNINKIILDSYTQEASAGGFRYPKARTDIFNAFEKGALIFNYLGHGGEDGLASERIWEKSDSQNLNNQFKFPLFITITCEFSRFDNPTRPTAGEFTYWNPKGGAIAMITTIREISQFNGEIFNDRLTASLLSYDSNQDVSIAEALRIAKNNNPNSSTNVVFYIGDPAIKLAIPKPKIRLTKVNDIPVSQQIDDFKSLGRIKLSGELTDENNNLLTDYNGDVATAIFDKNITRTTFNNDNNSPAMNFTTLGETIFRGNASVVNGLFEFNFVVPRDIRIPLNNGRISFYATKSGTNENQTGYDTTIKIGGINENAAQDNISPKVKLYMNDDTFVSGGITNSSPFLLALLEDENGINTASGIGHDITAVLDGDVSNPFVLNDYYQTDTNDFTKGTLRFPLRNIAPGLHTVTFKVWDVYNNPTTVELQFLVVSDEGITLTHVLNYPNPFVNYTEFWFTHNRPFEPLEIQIQVLTVTGKIVWSKNQVVTTEGFLSRDIVWDGRDDFGEKIGKGVYIYKLTVKSSLTNKKAEKFEKLVIL
ncbi:type IX secretion system sortase PorU [Flavobacterium sp. F-380]|uniref:Type IX secretion system sortase PorU n=1 Tax=Flavobacterium kayseriense TaxID=2764714 RepID=A0ABR7J7X9_9FLAO|nr:type IX secretion system sortase PorU [Flavobacterium kayseriense]MBC5841591.1 type IX secretion system sortase PorU [Flavobacterium kayseriense]MBC5848119.1 type IX secretion system sortase PorU [Flavobacterium kayseriense]